MNTETILLPNEGPWLRSVCEGCGEDYVDWEDENDSLCFPCKKREAREWRNHQVNNLFIVVPFYVAAIGISRHYGGPEEGGWWYDVTDVIEARRAWTWRDGLRHARELRANHPTCPRGRGSVIGGEDVYIQTFRDPSEFPEPEPKPRYE